MRMMEYLAAPIVTGSCPCVHLDHQQMAASLLLVAFGPLRTASARVPKEPGLFTRGYENEANYAQIRLWPYSLRLCPGPMPRNRDDDANAAVAQKDHV